MIENRGMLLVKEYQESGLSQREFCRKVGVKRSTLRYWLDRVKDYQVGDEIHFCELVVDGGDEPC